MLRHSLLLSALILLAGCTSRPDPDVMLLRITSDNPLQEYHFTGTVTVDGVTTDLGIQSTPWTMPITARSVHGTWKSQTADAIISLNCDSKNSRPLKASARSLNLGVLLTLESQAGGNGYIRLEANPILPPKKPATP